MIQDHLLGEIKETDNSVRSLYEARKIELKLAQRKLLRIVTPTAVSVEAIRKRANHILNITLTVSFVDILMTKVSALPLAKLTINVMEKTTLGLCVSPKNLESRCDSRRPNEARKIDAHTDAMCTRSMKMSVMRTAQWRT